MERRVSLPFQELSEAKYQISGAIEGLISASHI